MAVMLQMSSLARFTIAAAAVLMVLSLAALNCRLYQENRVETAIAQLQFLENSLDAGGAERMQFLFPEGYVFTWALYGLASAQVAQALPPDGCSAQRGAPGGAESHCTY